MPWDFPSGPGLRIFLPMQGTGLQSCFGKIPHAVGQPSPCATITEPMCLEPMLCNKRSPPQWEAQALQLDKAQAQQQRARAPKNTQINE